MQNAGLDALLEALRQSGMNIEGNPFAKGASGSGGSGSGGSGSAGGAGASGAGASGAGAGTSGAPGGAAGGSGGAKGGRTIGSQAFSFNPGDWLLSRSKKGLALVVVVVLLIAAAAYWWFHPPINIHSIHTWMFVTVFVLAPLFLVFKMRADAYARGTKRYTKNEGKARVFKIASFVPVGIVCLGLIGALASFSFFPGNAAKYASILSISEDEFSEDIAEVDYSQIPVIDRDSAELLGSRAMGTISDYVSQFEISSLYSQINYDSSPVRVSPLVYADLFKWLKNRVEGIPAYVVVDMTTQDTEIVRIEDGAIMYSQSEPLARNIERHVQLSYPFYMFDEIAFEIDEDGHPWWICPVQQRTIGLFGGRTIQRVVLCDAVTGECTDLAVEDVPEWVDRVYPADLLVQQYNWYGSFANGWINSWLGQESVVQTTPGTNGQLGYNYIAKDDDVWVYSGVTSATSDSSIVGFVLVNQRTAEAHFYKVAGATEESAMSSAEGQVQHLGYDATFPLLINIGGQPTYFMALKDDAGLVKMFAMIDIQRYQNVATGDTVAETQQTYKELLATNGVELQDADVADAVEVVSLEASGCIETMATAVVDGNSHFYVRLEGDDHLYDFALPDLIGILLYGEGDEIHFTYEEGESMRVALAISG